MFDCQSDNTHPPRSNPPPESDVPSPASALSPELQARYGLAPMAWWKRALGISLGAVLVAVLGYGAWQLSDPSVNWQVTAYHVVSSQQTTISFEVTRDARTTVVCVIRAQDENNADVGYATVTIPPGAAAVRATYPLATLSTAVIIDVLGCADNGPPQVDEPQFAPGTTNPPQQPTVAGG
jgi:hypothetical protein